MPRTAEESRTAIPPHPTLPEYYHLDSEREPFVRRLFDDTARWYEEINTLFSFGSGTWYRREALKRAGLKPGMVMLDVATGTGVVARAAAAIIPARDIIGLDPSIGMLLAGRKKSRIQSVEAMGESLPFAAGRFDLLSIGYALRHMSDLRAAFAEHLRVLRPGGRILILEITPPKSKVGYAALRAYMNGVVPAMTRLLTRSSETETLMRYYWDTIRECVPPQQILTALTESGFQQVERRVRYGVMTEYIGTKPLGS
jgi:demethylmenaquinone methyltransferase/2-methoxy-6-polyprenyl-1,4-benzoquinol methylase